MRARKHAAHLVESALCARCDQHDETEARRLWECEHNNTIDLPPVPPAARTLGNAETCPALWIRGLVPAQFLHKIPEDTPLFGCKEAATSDIISRSHGEHTLVASRKAPGGCNASDTRYCRVGTAAIILDFPSAALRIYLCSSSSTRRPPHSPTATRTRSSAPIEPLSRRLEKAFTMRAGWMQALPEAPQTTPSGEFWAFILALTHTRGPLLNYADYLGLVSGFTQTAIFPRLAHSRNYGHALALYSPEEVPRWKSATWAATPRQPTWSNDALSSRRFWVTTSRHGCSSIHISSNSPPASVKGATWLT